MKYLIHTYGCQMNVHESEKLAGILEQLGYTETCLEDEADIIVFNTCCIRDSAETKIIGNIGAVKPLKEKKRSLIVAVVGCMTEQQGSREKIMKSYPFVDIILGTFNAYKLGEAIENVLTKRRKIYQTIPQNVDIQEGVPIKRTKGTNAYINISYGCNNFCTYCIVPYVRGRERSRNKTAVLDDVKRVLDEGYREITLLGQNVNSYGHDFGEQNAFSDLLYQISKLDGKFRIRFMTCHPKDFCSEIPQIIAQSPNLCKSIHLPVQSGSDRVLQLMNRRYTRERYLEIIQNIKSTLPDVGISSDIIVGFPEEQDEDFAQTMDIIEKVRFSNAFMFVYSIRKGTPAAKLVQVSKDIKKQRITTLVNRQNEITRELSLEMVGKQYEILVEDVQPKLNNYVCGRTDSGRLINIEGNSSLIGSFVNVVIEQSKNSSLFGKIVRE